jgi:hypothetical protein
VLTPWVDEESVARQMAVLAHRRNVELAAGLIELINRWHKKEAAQGSKAGLPMRQVYTQVQSTLPTMKEFSRAL